MNIIVAGSRNFDKYKLLEETLNKYVTPDDTIISGVAKGADMLGIVYSYRHNIKLKRFPAKWDTYGKSAGYRRNVEMADNADMLIAFWDGMSRGTKHMIDIMNNQNKKVIIINY